MLEVSAGRFISVKSEGDGVVTISINGFNHGKPLFLLDTNRNILVHVSSDTEIKYGSDADGYCDRNIAMVPSQTDDDKEYMVTKVNPLDPRTWTCSCPDFIYRRRELNQTCKHIGYAYSGTYEYYHLR